MKYRASGEVEWRAGYAAGKREGAFESFHPGGAKSSAGTFREGKEEGVWSYWTSDGRLDATRSGTYAAGVRTGA